MTALQPRPSTSWTEQVFSREQARAAGWTDAEVRSRLASGSWTALRRGLYCATADLDGATAGRRLHLELLALQRHLDRPTAAFSHRTAAQLTGITTFGAGDGEHRLVDPTRWRSGADYRMTRAELPVGDLARRGPFTVTGAARTLVDLCRELDELDAVATLDRALLRGQVTREALDLAVQQARFVRGTPLTRRAVERSDGRSESWLESAWRVRHTAAGLPEPELQVEIWAGGQLVKVLDGYLRAQAIGFETDGKIKFTDPYGGRDPAEVLWAEKRAEDAVRALGIRVVRPTMVDVGSGWTAFEARVAREVAAPVPALQPFTAVQRDIGRLRPPTSRG
jgi:hypothetical protein